MIVAGTDIETTGLDQEKGHRIIEICLNLYDLEKQNKLFSYVQRIHPHRAIDAKAQEVHGITIHDLANSPDWEEVAPRIQKILSKCDLVVGHNGDYFDMPFIALELMRVGLEVPRIKTFDTMVNGRWATSFGKNPNLGELCFALNIPYDADQAHGAEYDVDVMMQCFFEGVKRGFYDVELLKGEAA